MPYNPTAWAQYWDAVNSGRLPRIAGLSRFQARYSMASRLEGVHFQGLSDRTTAGYTEALRVGLCYSAAETLESAIEGKWTIKVVSPTLADHFRSARCTRLRELLLSHTQDRTLASIKRLSTHEQESNVRAIAAGMRHLVFHGVLTPDGAGLGRSAWMRTFARDLSTAVLRAADARMSDWLTQQLV